MLRTTLALVPLVWLAMLAAACSLLPYNAHDDGVSDQEYIAAASNTPQAQAFMGKYPQAQIVVDRDGTLAVDFRYDKVSPTSTTQNWEGIRLRVFIDPRSRQPADRFLDCRDETARTNFIKEDLIPYLEQYSASDRCP